MSGIVPGGKAAMLVRAAEAEVIGYPLSPPS